MENEKGETCPPLQLKNGEQRHRGAWSPGLGPQGARGARENAVSGSACPAQHVQGGPSEKAHRALSQLALYKKKKKRVYRGWAPAQVTGSAKARTGASCLQTHSPRASAPQLLPRHLVPGKPRDPR